MRVLVAYATRHGSTAGIAERIGARLSGAGHDVDVRRVEEVADVEPFDAVVLGAAAYMYHWLKPAGAFATRHRERLAQMPLWLFSSGPIGRDRVDKHGRDVLQASRPREFDRLATALRPRGEQVFFGAWDANAPAVGIADRFMHLLPKSARNAMPSGDFREWDAIDAWADSIAAELAAGPQTSSPR